MDLQQRMERLERQNRLLKLAAYAVLVVVSTAAILGARDKAPNVIRTEKVEIVDGDGTVRG